MVAQTSSWAERLPQSAARGYPGTREPELPDVGEGIPVVPSVENDSIVCRVVNDGVEVADPWTLPHVIHRRPRRRSGEIEDPRVVEKVSVVAAEHHHSLPDGVIDGGVTVPGRRRSPRGREKFPGSGAGEAQGPDVVVEDAVVVAAENQDAVLYWIVDRSVAAPRAQVKLPRIVEELELILAAEEEEAVARRIVNRNVLESRARWMGGREVGPGRDLIAHGKSPGVVEIGATPSAENHQALPNRIVGTVVTQARARAQRLPIVWHRRRAMIGGESAALGLQLASG